MNSLRNAVQLGSNEWETIPPGNRKKRALRASGSGRVAWILRVESSLAVAMESGRYTAKKHTRVGWVAEGGLAGGVSGRIHFFAP